MLKKVQKYIHDNKLLSPHAKVIVGLSGGMDSVVMLDALMLLGYSCIAAHCNFHLRGEESNRDADFVKKWCESIEIPFVSTDFDTQKYAADKKISIEMAARELRYSWFETIRQQYDAEAIVVAHHKDDSVETVLLNLVRGTGIKGLSGILPKNGNIVRPFLCVTRKEIENYVAECELPFVFDSTNSEDVYTRNFIRLNIIPQLEELNPSVKDAIYRTSQNMAEAEKMYSSAVLIAKEKIFDGEKIDIFALKQTPSSMSVLFEILSPLGFNSSVIEYINRGLNAHSGKVFFSGKHRLIKSRDYFLLDPLVDKQENETSLYIDKTSQEISTPIRLNISIKEMPVEIKKEKRFLYVDVEKLTFPLELRKWQSGDWFIPFGMKGKKKVSDYFTDRKFDLKEKENTWLLVSDQKIVWIVGERSDNRFRVTSKTNRVLVIELKEN
ncbi:MAG: tRNA lysidine(34) synthetase TilS [Dysgonamonadaceae bacterium]|jgi:tRNA(Ile)-lysidine synthase|nr:tRNA lysidine(34) synthetase TilS [Dysgonamonadaceae bacterium]